MSHVRSLLRDTAAVLDTFTTIGGKSWVVAVDLTNKRVRLYDGTTAGGLVVGSAMTAAAATFLGAPTSANLAAAVSDETGSGPLVFANGPVISGATLPGTTTLPGSGAISSGGSIGITRSSPTQKLDINSGNISLFRGQGNAGSVQVGVSDGSGAMVPGANWWAGMLINSDASFNSYISFYTINANALALERMRLQPSGGVSIGTTTDPGVGNLLVNGTVAIGTSSGLAALSVGAGSLTDATIPIQISTGGAATAKFIGVNKNGSYGLLVGYSEGNAGVTGAVIRVVTADSLNFIVNNTTTAGSIDSSGSWTINGFQRFFGSTSSFPALKRSGTTLQHRLADDSADGPMSASNGTFSGNIAVGTTSPNVNNNVDARSATTTTAGFISIANSDGTKFAWIYNGAAGSDNPAIAWNTGSVMRFGIGGFGGTSFTETARITSAGFEATGTIKTGVVTVATLPTAGVAGRRYCVNNALTPTYGAAVVGGGAVTTSVLDTGAGWNVG